MLRGILPISTHARYQTNKGIGHILLLSEKMISEAIEGEKIRATI